VIPQTDAAAMPVEDPTVEWTSTPVRVAAITIDPQTFDSAEQMAFFANLSWTPWNVLPQHRPLGGINGPAGMCTRKAPRSASDDGQRTGDSGVEEAGG
jgi:hypothetical protein